MAMPSSKTTVAPRRAQTRAVLGLISFSLSLLYPLAMLTNAIALLATDGFKYPLAFFYTAIDYVGCPFVLVALLLGLMALVTGPSKWGQRGLVVSGASLLFITIGVMLALLAQ